MSLHSLLTDVTRAVAASRLHTVALYLLGNVRGFPPIIQTVHLLGIAAVMGSIVLIDLKVLGIALPSQGIAELTRRATPWLWGALPMLALSGLVFVFARPQRYFSNPVFGFKFAMLVPALGLALFQRAMLTQPRFQDPARGGSAFARIVAAFSLVLWVGVAMAGRWIAYADYLFPEGQ